MARNLRLWQLTKAVEIKTDLLEESVTKISNIGSHLFVQSHHNLYHGVISADDYNHSGLELQLREDWRVLDIDSCADILYIVDTEGSVFKCTQDLEKVSEIVLNDNHQCPRGHTETKCKMKVSKIAIGEYGQLFITDQGQLWACGYMPQIGINSEVPRKVNFFAGRLVFSVNIGNDFAIAIVNKRMKSNEDADESDEEDVFVTKCRQCLSTSQLTSPGSQNSLSSEICPLGVKLQGSYDIETTSTSSKNDSSICSNSKLPNQETEEAEKKDDDASDNLKFTSATEKNIIFRNTEAAKEFLTRQISRMSSAGEEYLVECTEKPTRIIKENMTNVASFVYEGVKTVGDKVVTLSRHVSGSSDNCTSMLDPGPGVGDISRTASKDDCLCSLSQCTSERDLQSEAGLRDRVAAISETGAGLLNCEVWTWGNIVHGQLGKGGGERYVGGEGGGAMPAEDKLGGGGGGGGNPFRHIFSKIVGAHRVYELPAMPPLGDSSQGIGDIIKRERPMIITKLSNIGVCKVSVENYHAAALTLDGRAFIWGRNDHNQVTMDSNIDQSSPKLYVNCNGGPTEKHRIKDIICGKFFTALLTTNLNVTYFGKEASKSVSLYLNPNNNSHKDDVKIRSFNNLLSTSQFTLLNVNSFVDNYFSNFTVNEQKFLEEMLLVHANIVKPLRKKLSSTPNASLYEELCQCYIDLMHFSAANVCSLLEHSNGVISLCDITIFKHLEEFIFIYKQYITVISNVVSIDGFHAISKSIEIPQSLFKIRPEISKKDPKSNRINEELIISNLLQAPVERIDQVYTAVLKNYMTSEVVSRWSQFVDEQSTIRNRAQATKEFWLNSGKVVDFLKSSDRRLIRDSHTYPLNLHNASRFTTHWFVLFTDVFVHMNGSTPHVHNLSTIWIEPQQEVDASPQQYQISLKMPEDSLLLYTTEAEEKIEWFHSLQNAIKNALNKSEALQPPIVRNGTYTFTKSGFTKDAAYTGRWLNGKMHGSGKLEWPDSKIYTGQFSNNQMTGYGVMEIPNLGIYEGHWRENQQNGAGMFSYSNTDFYKGNFKDGQPHGHGFLRKGNFMANTASFYIGDWVNGMKNGYGVNDDIVSGEKYIGGWLDNKKHGVGLIITSDGVYYEGVFSQDTLTGHGVMVLEDGTRYEGEFKGAGTLNGKGTLTLPSGHTIEGHLTGSWAEGIKISNGILTPNKNSPEKLGPSTNISISINQKWKALFKQCHQVFGIPEPSKNGTKPLDTQKIWQNVAVHLANASTIKKGGIKKNEKIMLFQNSLNNLDIIPPFGREKLDHKTYHEVKNYLLKAFESSFHPLGTLLNDLSEAYATTYGGRAHPLLLTHAISELHYICKRMYEIVRFLFPALPTYDKDCLVESECSEEVVNYQSLLYPIILPKVHHPLFSLFTLKNEQQERQYKRTLMEWNKQSDYTLMAFLSVDHKFLKLDPSESSNHAFEGAIEWLQQLKSTFSPMEKLLVIRQTVEKMTPVVQELLGETYVWNMDDLFPVFLFVVVRARIPELGAELDFVDNFMDPSLESGELGIMYTTLKASYQQILQEKSSISY